MTYTVSSSLAPYRSPIELLTKGHGFDESLRKSRYLSDASSIPSVLFLPQKAYDAPISLFAFVQLVIFCPVTSVAFWLAHQVVKSPGSPQVNGSADPTAARKISEIILNDFQIVFSKTFCLRYRAKSRSIFLFLAARKLPNCNRSRDVHVETSDDPTLRNFKHNVQMADDRKRNSLLFIAKYQHTFCRKRKLKRFLSRKDQGHKFIDKGMPHTVCVRNNLTLTM